MRILNFEIGTLVKVNSTVRLAGWSHQRYDPRLAALSMEIAHPADVVVGGGTIGMIVAVDADFVLVLWDEKAGWFRRSLFVKDWIEPVML